MNRVTWDDPGQGSFKVAYGTTTTFFGDYARELPEGYELEVGGGQLNLAGGDFTNNGTITLKPDGKLHLSADTTLSGNGELSLSRSSTEVTGVAGCTLTVGPNQRIRGIGEINVNLINDGLIEAGRPYGSLTLKGSVTNRGTFRTSTGHLQFSEAVTNSGSLELNGSGRLNMDGILTVDSPGRLSGQPAGTIEIQHDLVGNTRTANQDAPRSRVLFDGAGTASTPQLLEVMSQDAGANVSGFDRNFAYSHLALAGTTYVRLADDADNADGTGAEALYVNALQISAGATLDLNGLHVYTRVANIEGAVVGGTVDQLPDGGPIQLNTPAPGSISLSGELDEWTFFGRAGQRITVECNKSDGGSAPAFSPFLPYADVKLLDSNDSVLASASGWHSIVQLSDIVLPGDGQYRVQVEAATNTGNYTLAVWDFTPDVASIVFNQQATGRIEWPHSVDQWNFAAVAGQQVRFDLINTAGAKPTFQLTGPNSWWGFTDLMDDSDLLTLPTSGAYQLTARPSSQGYGGTYTFRLEETAQTDLPLGTVYDGQFVASGQAQLFRVEVSASQPMLITLDDTSTGNHNELYVKMGSPPTRGDYDYTFSTAPSSDQQILIPMAPAGMWYVLVYADHVRAASDFTLAAEGAGIFLYDFTPDRHGNGVDTTMTLTGAGFDRTTTVELVAADDTAYAATVVEVDSTKRLTATFAAGAVPAGQYVVKVSRSDGGTDQSSDKFEFVGGAEAGFETNLVIPAALGYQAPATIYVEYANTGDVAMPAPLLILTAEQNGVQGAIMTLDSTRVASGFWTDGRPQGFSSSIQIIAGGETPGLLQPGESYRVPVYYVGWQQPWDSSFPPIDFELSVLTTEETTPVDWDALKPQLKPETISQEAWEPLWSNFVANVGPTWGDYVAMLSDGAAYLDRLHLEVRDVGQLLAFEFMQAGGMAVSSYVASAIDAYSQTPAVSLSFSRIFPQSIASRFELGPLGRGWSHNWDMTLEVAEHGTVTILGSGGSRRTFQPDLRGGYIAQPGDHGILLELGDGTFAVREKNGLLAAFHADGKLNHVLDTNANRITANYTDDRLTSLVHSAGQSLLIDYNVEGRIERVTDDVGRETTFTYDVPGEHLITVEYFDGRIANYEYSVGQGPATEHALTGIESPGGKHEYFGYDENGRLARISRDGDAEAVTFTYGTAGQVSATDALGETTKYYFDHRGLLVKVQDPSGNSAYSSFDNSYNLTQITDPTGHSYSYDYDQRGNLTESKDPLGHTTTFAYDGPYDRLTLFTDADGNTTSYSYDEFGNLTSTSYADGSGEYLTYDSAGNVDSWQNRRGNVVDYTYLWSVQPRNVDFLHFLENL